MKRFFHHFRFPHRFFESTNMYRAMFPPFLMMTAVVGLIGNLKILYSIIVFYAIDMVNNFIRTKNSTKVSSHDMSVFENISCAVGKRMLLVSDHDISCVFLDSSTLPKTGIFTPKQITMRLDPWFMSFLKLCTRCIWFSKQFAPNFTLNTFVTWFTVQRMILTGKRNVKARLTALTRKSNLFSTIFTVFHRVNIPTTWIEINTNLYFI